MYLGNIIPSSSYMCSFFLKIYISPLIVTLIVVLISIFEMAKENCLISNFYVSWITDLSYIIKG